MLKSPESPTVAFVNIDNSKAFFTCSPAEARYAKRMVEGYRKNTECIDSRVDIERVLVDNVLAEGEKIPDRRSVICCRSSHATFGLTMSIASFQALIDIAKEDMGNICSVFVSPIRGHDIEMWGSHWWNHYPNELAISTGILLEFQNWLTVIIHNDMPEDMMIFVGHGCDKNHIALACKMILIN